MEKRKVEIKGISIRDVAFKKSEVNIDIEGTSPLITHRFSDRIKAEMLATQMKKPKPKREKRDPDKEYKESLYPLENNEGRYGFPVMGIKNAMVRAGKKGLDIPMTDLRVAFQVKPREGEESTQLLEIDGEPRKREDIIKLQGKSADLRYRAEFPKWRMTIHMVFNPSIISAEQLTYLLHLAGWSVGIGDWRPEKSGNFGTFKVKDMPD
jgi:hypothetical protein